MLRRIVMWAVGLVATYVMVQSFPDVKRYLRMRQM
ncbi:MAG: DUF6893 family small protein [Gemmatimonadaceae bacterium]